MTLKCIGSGSSGNSYALIDNDNKILLLDLGLPAKEIKQAIDYRISDVVGAVVTHRHSDHSKSVEDFEKMGIHPYRPYVEDRPYIPSYIPVHFKKFTVQAFDLTSKDGKWMHTNADGSECPCYGFLITHPDMGRLLYVTDTELVKWRFKDINHILISCNYQSKYMECGEAKRNHVLMGHMELETVKEFIKTNNSNALRNVILCHLSRDNANAEEMVAEVQKIVPGANVDYARAGLEVELRRADECPF